LPSVNVQYSLPISWELPGSYATQKKYSHHHYNCAVKKYQKLQGRFIWKEVLVRSDRKDSSQTITMSMNFNGLKEFGATRMLRL
jgi:hypothetical protein